MVDVLLDFDIIGRKTPKYSDRTKPKTDVDLTPFRNRDYRFLYAAQSVSLIGTMVTYVALPYQMYRLTGSSFSVGLLGLVELVPLLTTAFIGGAIADAVDRRRIAIVTDIAPAAGRAT